MLEKFFNSSRSGPGRVRSLRESQHGPLLDRFSGELLRSRYANITARRHIRAAEHFAHWATSQGIGTAQWDKSVLERFGLHLRRRRCPFGHSGPAHQLTGASLFLEHLRLAGIIRNAPVEPGDRPALLISFRRWMREQRGTQDAALDKSRMMAALADSIAALPEREKLVLSLYYEQELNMEEVGAVLGLDKSTVCRVHGRALLMLRDVLAETESDVAAVRCCAHTTRHLETLNDRALKRGEGGFSVDEALDILIAPIVYRILFSNGQTSPDYVHGLLDRFARLNERPVSVNA